MASLMEAKLVDRVGHPFRVSSYTAAIAASEVHRAFWLLSGDEAAIQRLSNSFLFVCPHVIVGLFILVLLSSCTAGDNAPPQYL